MSKKTLIDCRSGKDVIKYVTVRHPEVRVRPGHGGHQVIVTATGIVPVPVHGNHDLGKGLRHKIFKQLVQMGVSVLALLFRS